ncbi:hypothetical protein, partial [uncultured Ruegeria sp.]|uniref:hypothetical protein n=1 Tax=uncultured Ruegeria sp. TaxID=259304 RepID=UPI002614E8B4
INDWMQSNQEPLAEEFFDDLFDELDQGGANGYRLKVEADDAGGNPSNWRIRSRKRGYRFRTDVARYKLVVDCVNEESTWVGRQVNMTIGVPEQRGNLLAGGYLGRLFDDIKGLIQDEGRDDLAKQYLLAAIFLNRCQ